MNRKKLAAIAAVAAVLTLGAGTAVVAQQGEDEGAGHDDDATEQPITGSSLERAKEAALAHVGGGEATETEVGDEEGYYEVEIPARTVARSTCIWTQLRRPLHRGRWRGRDDS